MKTNAFSIYDSKSGAFGTPFFMQAVGLAIRAFTDLVNDPKSTVNRYPADFVLYHIGEFDDSIGALISMSPHVQLGVASAFINAGTYSGPMNINGKDSILLKGA